MNHYKFLRIKIKRQFYNGRSSIAIFVTDASKKVRASIKDLHNQEKKQRAMQAENFTAVVSHELRTPLGSILFFIDHVHRFIL